MRICFVSNYYPPEDISGLSRYLYDTANYLANKGVAVHVMTSGEEKPKVERQGSVVLHKLPALNIFLEKKPDQRVKEIFSYLDHLIKKERIELVSCQDFHTWSYKGGSYAIGAIMAAGVNRIPCATTMHIGFLGEVDPLALQSTPWNKVICVSRYIGELAHDANIPIDKISIVYPGINLQNFRPGMGKGWLRQRLNMKDSDFVVLCAARITNIKEKRLMTEKGIPTLIKAFSIVAEKYDNARLVIAAAKPREIHKRLFKDVKKKLREQCQIFGIRDKVKIRSYDMEQMPYVYNGADVFVLPTQFEALGLVYAEAMACGLPVIGTAVGGVPEIVKNDVNGYLVEPEEPVELAKRICWIMEDQGKRQRFGICALKDAREKFDLSEKAENLLGVYSSIIMGKPEGGKKKAKRSSEMGILFREERQRKPLRFRFRTEF